MLSFPNRYGDTQVQWDREMQKVDRNLENKVHINAGTTGIFTSE